MIKAKVYRDWYIADATWVWCVVICENGKRISIRPSMHPTWEQAFRYGFVYVTNFRGLTSHGRLREIQSFRR